MKGGKERSQVRSGQATKTVPLTNSHAEPEEKSRGLPWPAVLARLWREQQKWVWAARI